MMHYVFAPPSFYSRRAAFCPTECSPCGFSPCASPLLPIVFILFAPCLLRLAFGLVVMALTVMVNLAPLVMLGIASHSVVNAMSDDEGNECRRWFATKISTPTTMAAPKQAEGKAEEAKLSEGTSTKAKSTPSVVHDVSSATSVRLDEDKVTVVFAIPGVRLQDLEVNVLDENVLRVTGETSKGSATYRVAKDVQLPPAVDMETMSATHEDGVLSVEVKRKIRRVTIPISSLVEVKASTNGPSVTKKEDEWEAIPAKSSSAKTLDANHAD